MISDNKNDITHTQFAFEPIVNIHTGASYGYDVKIVGFEKNQSSIISSDDFVYLEKAIWHFTQLPANLMSRLFISVDAQCFHNDFDLVGTTQLILQKYNLNWAHICFVFSGKIQSEAYKIITEQKSVFQNQKIKIAIDAKDTGFTDLQSLYLIEPNLIKIDSFLINDISNDTKKLLFLAMLVNLAHVIGCLVIAEGVETKKDYYCCRNIGCDLIQGNIVAQPVIESTNLLSNYPHIYQLSSLDRRVKEENDKKLILSELEFIQPVLNTETVVNVFETFKNRKKGLLPVVDQSQEPVGIVRESIFKQYAYSRFGRELLEKASRNQSLASFISHFPMAEVHTQIETILEIYALNKNIEGIIITDNLKYAGFLSAQSLLKVLNDKNLAIARDLNPLTKLPGNKLIHEYVSNGLQIPESQFCLVYFDFDNFKAYNDCYGFRQGDRALHLFAQIIRRKANLPEHFIGHIGGDDFFMGIKEVSMDTVKTLVLNINRTFKKDVESFYDKETLVRGFITSKDRKGITCNFPLMTISSVIINIPANHPKDLTLENISKIIAIMKKRSKASPTGLCNFDLARIDHISTNFSESVTDYLDQMN